MDGISTTWDGFVEYQCTSIQRCIWSSFAAFMSGPDGQEATSHIDRGLRQMLTAFLFYRLRVVNPTNTMPSMSLNT